MCLDFANTLGGLRGGETQEYLSSYDDLVAWGQQMESMATDNVAFLLLEKQHHPHEANAVLASARTLREAIYRIFAAIATNKKPTDTDLATLNTYLGKSLAGGRIVPVADGFGWEWVGDRYALDQMLGPVARSAAQLLTSPQLVLVRECMNTSCSWLFVDHTKNHRRRWCSATGCGNVAKVRRHRQRQRPGPTGS
ncbi:hypothetical protein KDA_42530 [Dictyobacter alpinus]|uniref:Zinc finger CGNR domain-containing protein n=2 Tax=Dictyobacter alpinus TaxID=2014873 RepID=A0A402BBQ6_9CHLR|nr:hypothetical protein KDA_42530 [Dictyobacter alpinus]